MNTINCPVCNARLLRHKRVTGFYRLYICRECEHEFFIQKDNRDYSCAKFEDCATSMKKFNCKHCTFSALVTQRHDRGAAKAPVAPHFGIEGNE